MQKEMGVWGGKSLVLEPRKGRNRDPVVFRFVQCTQPQKRCTACECETPASSSQATPTQDTSLVKTTQAKPTTKHQVCVYAEGQDPVSLPPVFVLPVNLLVSARLSSGICASVLLLRALNKQIDLAQCSLVQED